MRPPWIVFRPVALGLYLEILRLAAISDRLVALPGELPGSIPRVRRHRTNIEMRPKTRGQLAATTRTDKRGAVEEI